MTSESSTRGTAYTNPFTYDGGTSGGPGNVTAFKSSTANRSYNADNQLTNSGFTYDGNGSPTTYATKALTYDPEQRLTSYSGTVQTNGYDGDGLRAWKQKGAATTRTYFLYDGALPVCEFNSAGGLSATNTFGADDLVSRHVGLATTLYAFDERGNVSQRLTPAGAVTSSDLYDGYGGRTSTVPVQPDPFGYGGQFGYYTDTETGFLLCTHRFYDPAAGRFVTRDPIGYRGGVNLYGYVGNDPANAIDPFGLTQYIVTDQNGSYDMDVPSSQDIDKNIRDAYAWLSAHPGAGPAAKEGYVRDHVHHGTVGDYKDYKDVKCPTLRQQRDLAGNFNFGALGTVMGFPETVLAVGGHLTHVEDTYKLGGGGIAGLKAVLGSPFHPDDRQQAIEDGAEYVIGKYLHFSGRNTLISVTPMK